MRSKSSPPRARSVTRYTGCICQPRTSCELGTGSYHSCSSSQSSQLVSRYSDGPCKRCKHELRDALRYQRAYHGHPFQHSDLVSHHVFSTGHEPLVDHLCRIVPPCINVYAFFHYRVGASSQRLSGPAPIVSSAVPGHSRGRRTCIDMALSMAVALPVCQFVPYYSRCDCQAGPPSASQASQ
jgi:hypothetical protein